MGGESVFRCTEDARISKGAYMGQVVVCAHFLAERAGKAKVEKQRRENTGGGLPGGGFVL